MFKLIQGLGSSNEVKISVQKVSQYVKGKQIKGTSLLHIKIVLFMLKVYQGSGTTTGSLICTNGACNCYCPPQPTASAPGDGVSLNFFVTNIVVKRVSG